VRRAEAEAATVSAVIPAYNEEAVIEQTVRDIARVLRGLTADYEVIVVNDGSHDNTGQILARLTEVEPSLHLRVVTHERNYGYGAALASGFDAADLNLVFLTDGDRQFDVSELASFLAEMNADTDLIVGWRRQRADSALRLLNAWGWKMLVNAAFGYTARDVDCAFKLFRRRVWSSFRVYARGATFSAEFVIKARRHGFHVKELPVNHYPRRSGNPTGARPAVIARAFLELFRLRRRLDSELDRDLRSWPARPRSYEPDSVLSIRH